MALVDGLQAYWKFDESSGNAADSSGNGNAATNVNSTAYATGKINNGADLERGSSNYFTVNDSASVSIVNGWSVSFWMKIESLNNWMIPFRKRSGENGCGTLIYANGDFDVNAGAGSFGGQTNALGLTTATWYHIVIYFNGATSKLYVNNAAPVTQNIPNITDPATALYIGANVSGGSDSFDGIIDEFGIWNRELTASDVSELYNGGSGLQYPFTTNTYSISVNDALTITESVTLTRVSNISVNDAITITESINTAFAMGISVSDAITISESVTVENTQLGGISVNDALTVSENITSVASIPGISVFDSITISENVTITRTTFAYVGPANMRSDQQDWPLAMDDDTIL